RTLTPRSKLPTRAASMPGAERIFTTDPSTTAQISGPPGCVAIACSSFAVHSGASTRIGSRVSAGAALPPNQKPRASMAPVRLPGAGRLRVLSFCVVDAGGGEAGEGVEDALTAGWVLIAGATF